MATVQPVFLETTQRRDTETLTIPQPNMETELTPQQAADLARVSRPFFLKLLDEGRIPSRMVGMNRCVLYRDVAHYIQEEEARRIKVMEELVAETERLGLYE